MRNEFALLVARKEKEAFQEGEKSFNGPREWRLPRGGRKASGGCVKKRKFVTPLFLSGESLSVR